LLFKLRTLIVLNLLPDLKTIDETSSIIHLTLSKCCLEDLYHIFQKYTHVKISRNHYASSGSKTEPVKRSVRSGLTGTGHQKSRPIPSLARVIRVILFLGFKKCTETERIEELITDKNNLADIFVKGLSI